MVAYFSKEITYNVQYWRYIQRWSAEATKAQQIILRITQSKGLRNRQQEIAKHNASCRSNTTITLWHTVTITDKMQRLYCQTYKEHLIKFLNTSLCMVFNVYIMKYSSDELCQQLLSKQNHRYAVKTQSHFPIETLYVDQLGTKVIMKARGPWLLQIFSWHSTEKC